MYGTTTFQGYTAGASATYSYSGASATGYTRSMVNQTFGSYGYGSAASIGR